MPARKKSVFKKSEKEVTKECVDLLKLKQIVHWRNNSLSGWLTSTNGGKRQFIKTGTKGLSDYSFLLNDGSGRTVMLEFKATGGKMSQDQIDFEKACSDRNVPYYCIDNVNDLVEILEIYGM